MSLLFLPETIQGQMIKLTLLTLFIEIEKEKENKTFFKFS